MSKILKQHERQQGNGAFRGTTFNEPRQRQHKATRGRLSGAVECHHGVGRESRGTSECTHHSAIPTSYPIDRIPETKTTRSSDRSEDESCTLSILTGLQAKGPSSPRTLGKSLMKRVSARKTARFSCPQHSSRLATFGYRWQSLHQCDWQSPNPCRWQGHFATKSRGILRHGAVTRHSFRRLFPIASPTHSKK